MNNEFIILITLIATFITILVGLIAIIKFLFNLSDRITKLEIEIKTELSKLNSKFDLLDERYKSTNEKIENVTNRLNQIETDNKNYIKKLTDKVLDVLPKSAL